MLDAGCLMLDAGCWMLDAGCWLLVAGCWLLVAGRWWLVAGFSSTSYQQRGTSNKTKAKRFTLLDKI